MGFYIQAKERLMETLVANAYPANYFASYTLDPLAGHWTVKGWVDGACVGQTTVIAPTEIAAIDLGVLAFKGAFGAGRKIKVTAEPAG